MRFLFEACQGRQPWIERFKHRHANALKTISGKAAAVDHTVTNAWKQQDLLSLLDEYGEDDIFNADQTGIFDKNLPNKSLALKGKRCTVQGVGKLKRG